MDSGTVDSGCGQWTVDGELIESSAVELGVLRVGADCDRSAPLMTVLLIDGREDTLTCHFVISSAGLLSSS